MKIVNSTLTRFQRKRGMAQCAVGSEMVLMHVDKGFYYALDVIGTRIWTLSKQPTSIQFLCEQLVGDYNVDLEQCIQDVTSFVEELIEVGILEVATDESM